jgi:hypothetical protein
MVQCEQSECFIARYGKGARLCTFVVTFWDSANIECSPQELEFSNSNRGKAIELFLKLCKRKPLYAHA